MPRRSHTSTRALEDLLPQETSPAGSRQDQVAKLLQEFDDKISGKKPVGGDGSLLKEEEVLAVPSFMVNQAIVPDPMDIDQKALVTEHHHASDSGLGSSVASSIGIVDPSNNKMEPPTIADLFKEHNTRRSTRTSHSISTAHSTVTRSASAISASFPRADQLLSKEAERHIRNHIIKPILDEETLKDFHPLVEDIPRRIGAKFISNLRDLEKTLFFLAPVSDDIKGSIRAVAHALRDLKDFAPSPQSFLKFCETSIECLHTTVDYLSERDQRRDTDRPYTNNYFLDLVEQIRRYAEIMARTREKQASGQDLDEMDYSPYVTPAPPSLFGHAVSESLMCLSHPTLHKPSTCLAPQRMLLNTYLLNVSDETITIEGGLSKNGKPAELVRKTKDGKVIPLSEHSLINEASPSSKRHLIDDEDMDDDDVYRSMARRRKSEKPGDVMHPCRVCDKEFKRPCDLTKHEKTHSRPWKCPDPKCKYHEHGWPTEKERDRHVNDKHNSAPQMYQCRFKPCTYSSKRESNCKQHMEKAHGWTYVRSKSNGRTKRPAGSDGLSPMEPLTPFMATPSSGMNNLTSPESNFMPSPAMPAGNNFPNFGFSTYTPGPSSSEDLFDFNAPMRRESVATTGSAMTFSSGSNFSPAPQQMHSAFDDALSPENLTFDQPLFNMNGMTNDFNMPVQQPTPAVSLNNGCDNTFAGMQNTHLSPTGQANMTLFSPPMENTHFDEALGNDMGFGQDFTLFDSAGPSTMAPAANNWFPDGMGTIGGQFDFNNIPTNTGFEDFFGQN